MRPLEQVSYDLFEKLRNIFPSVTLGNDRAEATIKPEEAMFYNFDFVTEGKDNLGNVTISLMDNKLQIFYSKNITENLNESNKMAWYTFLKEMRKFAMRNMLDFDTRDITKSHMTINDVRTLASSYNDNFDTADITESKKRMYGTTKSSYQQIGPTKMIVRHDHTIDETKMGARGRNIRAIYIENADGERFKVPTTNLLCGRIMARHIGNGGQMNDDFSKHVATMVNELQDLRYFVLSNRNKTYEDGTTKEMVEAAVEYYGALKDTLKGLRSQRGYKNYIENWNPETSTYIADDEQQDEDLKERFIVKSFNNKLEQALPHVAKAYQMHVKEQHELEESLKEYAVGKKLFGLTEEDADLFAMIETNDPQIVLRKSLQMVSDKLGESNASVAKFAHRACENWDNLNAIQKNFAIDLSKGFIKEMRKGSFKMGSRAYAKAGRTVAKQITNRAAEKREAEKKEKEAEKKVDKNEG